jgi:hypothetical protein
MRIVLWIALDKSRKAYANVGFVLIFLTGAIG